MTGKLTNRQKQARLLRQFRMIHRWTGVILMIFILNIAITGLLLGWKKQTTWLLPDTQPGISNDLSTWLPFDSLQARAIYYLRDSLGTNISVQIDRIDARPDKGTVKFVFADHYWGLQLDGQTGQLLQLAKRRSDFVENLHDASILDWTFKSGNLIKLIYTTTMGLALLVFTITGFWLWYGPKVLRQSRS